MFARKLDDRVYTYGDLLNFPPDEVWELIDGVPYLRAKPSGTHQRISRQLIQAFANYLEGKPCEVMHEFPIWPEGKPKNKNAQGYLVPDVLVYCDPELYTEDGLIGAPALVIEILSPSNARDDKEDKLLKYQAMGVKEYWIVSPEYRTIDVHTLDETGIYRVHCHSRTVRWNDLELDLNKIFPPLPAKEVESD